MISAVTGHLLAVATDRVQVAMGGLVLEILVPASDVPELRNHLENEITLYTIFDLEGDATRGGLTPRLIGFRRIEDRRFFQLFITVKGIGPKRALRALVEPTGRIAHAIESKDTRFLVQLPEIGKRTAEQIVAELAGKMASLAVGADGAASGIASTGSAPRDEIEQYAVDAAMSLGMARAEAEGLLGRARAGGQPGATTETLLREMLRFRGGPG